MEDLKERFWNRKDAFESEGWNVNTRKTKVMVSGSEGELFKRKINPCGVCGRRVTANSVLSTKYGNWVHGRFDLHQSTAASTWWCGPRPRLGWVEMAVGLPEGPSYPGHSPFIFSLCCPLNDRRRAAHSIFKIGRLFLLFLLSCPTLALLRLLILLLLLMSGNVHPNPGPIFPCSVCAGNVTWRGKSVQCCACSKWVHLRCSQLSLSNFRALAALTLGAAPPAVTL